METTFWSDDTKTSGRKLFKIFSVFGNTETSHIIYFYSNVYIFRTNCIDCIITHALKFHLMIYISIHPVVTSWGSRNTGYWQPWLQYQGPGENHKIRWIQTNRRNDQVSISIYSLSVVYNWSYICIYIIPSHP